MAPECGRSPSPPSAYTRLVRVASAQHGAFSRVQALACGIPPTTITRRLAAGVWERAHPGVYTLAGSPASWRRSLMCGCLAWGAGSLASHRTAAALWRLPGFAPGALEFAIPRGRARRGPGVAHRPLRLDAADASTLEGIPVTTPARTLIDIAATVPAETLEEALDDALRRGLVSARRLLWRLERLGTAGRSGAGALRRAALERTGAVSVPQSVLETRVVGLLRRAGLADRARRQHRVRSGSRVVAVVDFAFPAERVAVEADGYRWHGSRRRWEGDLARRNALTALGWRVVHLTWGDVNEHPEAALQAVRRALAAAP